MADWKVTSGSMMVREVNDEIDINKAAVDHLHSRGIAISDSVYFPPVVGYTSKGVEDTTAAYLNAVLFLPNAEVTGVPPMELIFDDFEGIGPIPNYVGMPEEKSLPASYRRQRMPGDDLHTGGMIALLPDAESAAKLAIEGGDPVAELHVTLFFIPDGIMKTEPQRDIIRAILSNKLPMQTITAQVVGAGTLGDEDAKVYLLGDSFMMKIYQEDIERAMYRADDSGSGYNGEQRSPWIAHLTTGYGKSVPLSKMTYRGEITFNRLRVAFGETYTDFDLDGNNQLPDDMLEYLGTDQASTDTEVALPPIELPRGLKSLLGDNDPNSLLYLSISDDDVAKDFVSETYGIKEVGSAKPGAAKLRAYWTRGPGAAKIRWGEPHDFYRCRDHLTKYVGARASGLCAIYHRSALGSWPGREGGKSVWDMWDQQASLQIVRLLVDEASMNETETNEGDI